MVGVHSDLCRQIERHGQSFLSLAQQIAITLVGFRGRAKSRVLAHRPQPAAVHRRIDAARKWKFARETRMLGGIIAAKIFLCIETLERYTGNAPEHRLPLGRFVFVGIVHQKSKLPARHRTSTPNESAENAETKSRQKSPLPRPRHMRQIPASAQHHASKRESRSVPTPAPASRTHRPQFHEISV